MTASIDRFVYDWTHHSGRREPRPVEVTFNDETLRDGLQSPSVRHPSLDERFRMLHQIAEVGIQAANLGFPGAGERAKHEARELLREVVRARLPLSPQCAARTVENDLVPIAEIAHAEGAELEVGMFIGSSPIRRRAEGWALDDLLRITEQSVRWAAEQGLRVLFVTEDTTRSRPEDIRRIYQVAVRAGASRICIADTVGFATPLAAYNIVRYVRGALDEADGGDVEIDWHGHNDRGLAVANALAAAAAGANRLHGTALGIGERVGNAPIEQLLVNARLLGWARPDLSALLRYMRTASRALGVEIPPNMPIVGGDAFRTATGVHAAALFKALGQGDMDLVDDVYSAVPARWFGIDQAVDVGPFSGASNVRYWLFVHGYEAADTLVGRILEEAKEADRTLTDDELHRLAGGRVSTLGRWQG